MIYLYVYLIGWGIGFAVFFLHPELGLKKALLLSHLVFTVGAFGALNFVAHTFLREKISRTIGWVSNGFQIELGFVSLGIGISGILCYWFRDGFWIATTIPLTTFLGGAGALHIFEIVRKKNYSPNNTLIVIPDFLIPLTIIGLLCSG